MVSRFNANPEHFFNESAPYLVRRANQPSVQYCAHCKKRLVTRRACNGWVSEHESETAKANCVKKRAAKAKRSAKK